MAVTLEETVENKPTWDGKKSKKAAFLAGIMAGMIMTAVMLGLLILGFTQRSIANLVSDKIASVAGAGITEFFIQNIGALGKEMLFFSVLIGQVLTGGLLGFLFGLVTGPVTQRQTVWRNSFILSVGFWFFFVLVGLPLVGQGFLGEGLGVDQLPTLVMSFGLFQLFGFSFGYSYLLLVPNRPAEPVQTAAELNQKISRRKFVGIVSATFTLVVGAALVSKAFGSQSSDYRANLGDLRPDGTVEGEITPANEFYTVSKNAFNPRVEGAVWKLEINGLVERKVTFDQDSLKKLPQKKVYHTLTCISNNVGGQYIGNAEWSGVPLRELLNQAGLQTNRNPKKIVFTCADGYKDSITLEKALEENTIFALEMNGAALTQDHGFPGRVLVPDIYGMKNAKWVTEITVIDSEFEGYWQQQGWDNLATIRANSSITFPADGKSVRAGQPTTIKGFAYAGKRDIEKVEVSVDGGKSWQLATVKPRLGANSWTLWRYDWTPSATPADYSLKVRAYEAGSKLQETQPSGSYPSGATGIHTVSVRTFAG